MVIDFINNIGVAVAFLLILMLLFPDKNPFKQHGIKYKMFIGVASGIFGIILMLSTVEVTEMVIVDLRHLALVISAVYGGITAGLITGLMVGLARFFLFGITAASTSALLVATVMGLFLGWLSTLKIGFLRIYVAMNVSYLVAASAAIVYFVKNISLSVYILQYYLGISAFAGVLIYKILIHIQKRHLDRQQVLYYKHMIDSTIDLLSTHDLKGSFKYASPSFEKITGHAPEDLIGTNPFDFYHPDDVEIIKDSYIEVLESLREAMVQYRFRKKDGQYVWLETLSKKADIELSDEKEIIAASRDITEHKQLEDQLMALNSKLQELSHRDGLTGLYNRRSFDYKIEEEWNRARREHSFLSVLFIDIDNFKQFNDTYGHQEGDLCLRKIAQIAESTLKRSTDYIARYGGEEFAVILPATSQENAVDIAEQIRQAVDSLSIPNEQSEPLPFVTISLGAATEIPNHENSFLELINKADQALFQAKKSGKNRVVHYHNR